MPKTAYEKIAQVITSNASTLSEVERNSLKGLLDGFNKEPQVPYPSYTITINYDKTIGQLIKVGKFGWKNDDITSKNFPSVEKGLVGVAIYLFNFDRDISSEDVIAEMNKQGCRPATLKELMELGAQYPDLQRKNWIVALGSTWRDSDGGVLVPCLSGSEGVRNLRLNWWGGGWDSGWRFAAVRK